MKFRQKIIPHFSRDRQRSAIQAGEQDLVFKPFTLREKFTNCFEIFPWDIAALLDNNKLEFKI